MRTLLVEDRGERITGALTTEGNFSESNAKRSWTSCRACMTSVPSLKYITTEERPSTDLERTFFNHETPLTALSTGMVIRVSTSEVESPGPSVCISTSGGANSGNTSKELLLLTVCEPVINRTTVTTTMATRRRRDVDTSHLIIYRLQTLFRISQRPL